jgi:hypothetical protein
MVCYGLNCVPPAFIFEALIPKVIVLDHLALWDLWKIISLDEVIRA